MIHVRFDGRSIDLNDRALGLLSDGELKDRLAQVLEVGRDKLRYHVVDRRPGGDVIVRPEAVYG